MVNDRETHREEYERIWISSFKKFGGNRSLGKSEVLCSKVSSRFQGAAAGSFVAPSDHKLWKYDCEVAVGGYY